MATPPFYTQSDLDHWSQWVDQPYDQHRDTAKKQWISRNLVPRLEYWCTKLLNRLEGYERRGKKDWLDRDRRHFRHYMWLRLLPPRHDEDLYFTIGIDYDSKLKTLPQLVIKLDFQRTKNAGLSKVQQEFLREKLIRTNGGAAWHSIDLKKTDNWEALMDECAEFIRRYESYYEQCLNGINSLPDSYRISRLTWNSSGWVMPSGREGKSKNRKTHEGKFGYGHEEWLLDTEKMVDDYHYAFLEPIRKQYATYVNKIFDIGLYSIDHSTGNRYWIGEIKNVLVIDEQEAERVSRIYKTNGWYAEMKSQITEAGADATEFNQWTNGQLFNIRFKVSDTRISDYELINRDHKIYSISRYTFLLGDDNALDDEKNPQAPPQFVPRSGLPDTSKPQKSYKREPKFVESARKHVELQKILVERLREKYGEENVTWEHPLTNGTSVDVVRKQGDKLFFYEIKTYSAIRPVVREALGQLLEYAYWKNNQVPEELIIVSDIDPDDGISYLEYLRNQFKLKLNYQKINLEEESLNQTAF